MKRHMLAALLTAVVALPAGAALKAGDNAPPFQAQASRDGKAFAYSLQEALRKGPVVVYFYPAAFTNGCNIQAHTFAVEHEKFAAAGATVVGVSLDDIGRLNAFSADPQSCAGKVTVASDAGGKIAHAYQLAVREAAPDKRDTRGASIAHGLAERTTFVVGVDGRIAAIVGGEAPDRNVYLALEAVRKLTPARP